MSTADSRNLLLVGGSSEIAVAIARRLASDGPIRPFLLGRDRDRLAEALKTLEQAGCVDGELDVVDADDVAAHQEVVARAFARMGGFDLVVLAVGVLGAQAGIDADPAEAARGDARQLRRGWFADVALPAAVTRAEPGRARGALERRRGAPAG